MGYLDDYAAKLEFNKNTLESTKADYSENFSKDASHKTSDFTIPAGTVETFEFHTLGKNKISLFPSKKAPAGSIFEMRDNRWLMYDVRDSDDIVTVGKIEEINYDLKWALNGEVITTPVVLTDNINKGMEDDSYLYAGSQKLVMFISKNTQTEQLNRMDRLMVDGIAYKIEKIDSFTFNGAYKILLYEDAIRQNDSEDIADYQEEIPITDGIVGSNTIVRGREEDYTLEVADVEELANWSIDTSDDEIELLIDGSVATISVGSSINNVGKTFNLTAEFDGAEYVQTITVIALF